MANAILNENERSVVIDIISHLNEFVSKGDYLIKKVGGETTLFDNKNHMFPDLIFYGDKSKSIILQGWEFKMPDVPIENSEFISDAARKANSLGLNSFVLWNFTYAVLYIKKNGAFSKEKMWNSTAYIRTRRDVDKYKDQWENNLDNVVTEINKYLLSGTIHKTFVYDAIGKSTISSFINRNKNILCDYLKMIAKTDSVMEAYISSWWLQVKNEYSRDELDAYHAYSKRILLNWISRLIFCHLIKCRQAKAVEIEKFVATANPREANKLFDNITSSCDFYNIFKPLNYDDLLPDSVWLDLLDLAFFLNAHDLADVDHSLFQDVLENTIDSYRREINGQYCTPYELAKILSNLTIKDWSKEVYDCCCGTGTIPKFVMQKKKKLFGVAKAFETTWASDKSDYPLQIANISLADVDAINIPAKLFKHNALHYELNESTSIINPTTGLAESIEIPKFHAIVSNLPFIHFEAIPRDDQALITKYFCNYYLSGKSDLSYYIPFSINDLLDENGYLGIVLSNSWLGTKAGAIFFKKLFGEFSIEGIHISGVKRWFDNADVVTTLLILHKRKSSLNSNIYFYLWKKNLTELAENREEETKLINSGILKKEIDKSIVEVSSYSIDDISSIQNCGLSLNVLFHKASWILKIKEKLISISAVFNIFRGSRRGWDKLFYPKDGEHSIEPQFLSPVLLNARKVCKYDANADGVAFCCHSTIHELKERADFGALEWISRFKDQKNGTGEPLQKVLQTSRLMWYEMSDNEKALFFTPMNPDRRLFFGRFKEPTFINQRLIGLNKRSAVTISDDLILAVLNSVLTMFFIEGAGFGRGLGVLDINKESISKIHILNPFLISEEKMKSIISLFKKLRSREIKPVLDEINCSDRIEFEKALFGAFGISNFLENVMASLKSMVIARESAKKDD